MHSYSARSAAGWVRSLGWTSACALLAAAALLFGTSAAFDRIWITMLAWLACAAIGLGGIVFRRALPPFFGLLLTLAAAINAAGYAFNLWHERTPFDEVVHGFTSFAGTVFAAWFILPRRPQFESLFWDLILIALLVGLAWEAFEWAIGIIGDPRDTIADLIMDIVGALAAAGLLRRVLDPDRGSTRLATLPANPVENRGARNRRIPWEPD